MQASEALTGILIVLGFFASVTLSLYYYFKVRNKERMAMIEKGTVLPIKQKQRNPIRSLKAGIFLMGIAIGIFLGHIVGSYTSIDDVVSFFVMILLFGGIALSLNYILELKLKKREE